MIIKPTKDAGCQGSNTVVLGTRNSGGKDLIH